MFISKPQFEDDRTQVAAMKSALHDGYDLAATAARSLAEAMEDGCLPVMTGPDALRRLATILHHARLLSGDAATA